MTVRIGHGRASDNGDSRRRRSGRRRNVSLFDGHRRSAAARVTLNPFPANIATLRSLVAVAESLPSSSRSARRVRMPHSR